MDPQSDYIIYIDESGDHGLTNSQYPMFVLAFCIFEKRAYVEQASPRLQWLKFKHFGHDMVVFHEHEIRKATGDFAFLTNAARRQQFMDDLNELIDVAAFTVVAVAVRKDKLKPTPADAMNPYHLALAFGLSRLQQFMIERKQQGSTYLIFESRGKKEDDELELEFHRVSERAIADGKPLGFRIRFAHKHVNSCGLQIADMIARPIGRKVMNPLQENRAYAIIEQKFDRSADGVIDGWGLKCIP